MGIKMKELMAFMEKTAPKNLAEEWDNVGLLVGSEEQDIEKVLLCLDITPKVVQEAVNLGVQLILSHHPFIFKGLKKIVAEDVKGAVIIRLIQSGINIFSAHTNLDVARNGVNDTLAEHLGLKNATNLKKYKSNALFKVVVFVPEEALDIVRDAMCRAGAGFIGNYSDCTFSSKGAGTFRPMEGTRPYIGTTGILERVVEYRIETIAPEYKLNEVINAMLQAHPYEEAAYDVYRQHREAEVYGLGTLGELSKPVPLKELAAGIKKLLGLKGIRVVGDDDRVIHRAAVFCGSYDDWMGIGKVGADVLITGEIKYHTAIELAQMGVAVLVLEHFSSEALVLPKLKKGLESAFEGLEVITSAVEAEPFKFY